MSPPPSQEDVRDLARQHRFGPGEHVAVTQRLVLRRWREDDVAPFAAMGADPAVMEHLGPLLDAEACEALARYADACFAAHGFGLAAVERRDDGAFLGFVGLHRHRWFPDDVEIGWRLARHAWGHGFATEAAGAWVDLAAHRHGLRRLISITVPDNTRSQTVMRNLGMRLAARDVREGLAIVVHAIDLAPHAPSGAQAAAGGDQGGVAVSSSPSSTSGADPW